MLFPSRCSSRAGLLRALVAIAVGLAACSSGADATEEPEPSAEPKARTRRIVEAPAALGLTAELARHFQEMASAEAFGGVAIGAGASPSEATEGFRAILRAPPAADAFADATTRGTTAGQLYGLTGLALVDPPRFQAMVDAFRKRTDAVPLWTSGCTGGRPALVADVVDSPSAARSDGPGDSISAWQARHPGQAFHADIVGGFFPKMLAGSWRGAGAGASPSASVSATPAPSSSPRTVSSSPGRAPKKASGSGP